MTPRLTDRRATSWLDRVERAQQQIDIVLTELQEIYPSAKGGALSDIASALRVARSTAAEADSLHGKLIELRRGVERRKR